MYGLGKALFAPEEGGDATGGAGGGEEKKGVSKDDVVPKTQFIAAINSANAKYEALKAQLDAVTAEAAKPKPVEPKKFTRAQLTTMVENREITQAQADAQMDFQMREEIRTEATKAATEIVSESQRKSFVDTEIARYKTVAPEILDDASETRQRIKEEYNYLVATLGDPNSVETQLKAIRSVLGPVDKLERARSGRASHESHRETGGGGEAPSRKREDGKLTYDDLTPREKAHYDRLINSGVYKDKKAVNEELAFANSNTRRKYGAMN